LYDLAELPTVEVPPLRWIVDGLIPEGGIGWLSGPPKESKSLLALDLVIHLAHAQPWIGRYRVEPMNSLYIAREDPLRRLKERAAEINSGYGYPDIPAGRALFLVREKFTLTSEKSLEWLETEAKRTGARLLILDVLNRMVPDLDELSAKDMAVMVSVLEIINRDMGLTVLCLDHTRKPQGPKSGRNRQDANPFDLKGSIAKYGAADFMLCLARTEQDGRLQLYCENKDADERPHILLGRESEGFGRTEVHVRGRRREPGREQQEDGRRQPGEDQKPHGGRSEPPRRGRRKGRRHASKHRTNPLERPGRRGGAGLLRRMVWDAVLCTEREGQLNQQLKCTRGRLVQCTFTDAERRLNEPLRVGLHNCTTPYIEAVHLCSYRQNRNSTILVGLNTHVGRAVE
jgi:hypothetical protein